MLLPPQRELQIFVNAKPDLNFSLGLVFNHHSTDSVWSKTWKLRKRFQTAKLKLLFISVALPEMASCRRQFGDIVHHSVLQLTR